MQQTHTTGMAATEGANRPPSWLNTAGALGMVKKSKMQIPVGLRLSAAKFEILNTWCETSLRKKSEVLGILLERVLELVESQAVNGEPVEYVVRRLKLGPPN